MPLQITKRPQRALRGDSFAQRSGVAAKVASILRNWLFKDVASRFASRLRSFQSVEEFCSKSEIADALGIDRSRVTQLLQQGLRNLRVELGDQHDERQLQER